MDADRRNQRIKELEAENTDLRTEKEQLRKLIKHLQDRIEELERQAARQAAPFRRAIYRNILHFCARVLATEAPIEESILTVKAVLARSCLQADAVS